MCVLCVCVSAGVQVLDCPDVLGKTVYHMKVHVGAERDEQKPQRVSAQSFCVYQTDSFVK